MAEPNPPPSPASAGAAAALALKAEGNALFVAKEYRKAVGKYTRMFAYTGLKKAALPGVAQLMAREAPAEDPEMDALRRTAKLNLAQCYLKLGEHERAERYAGEVIDEEPGLAKARYRRGLARIALGDAEGAAADLGRARELAPDDPGVAAALRRLAVLERREEARQRKAFGGLFERANKEQ